MTSRSRAEFIPSGMQNFALFSFAVKISFTLFTGRLICEKVRFEMPVLSLEVYLLTRDPGLPFPVVLALRALNPLPLIAFAWTAACLSGVPLSLKVMPLMSRISSEMLRLSCMPCPPAGMPMREPRIGLTVLIDCLFERLILALILLL